MSEKECIYCKEIGIKNTNVFIEIKDAELGPGWICKECFLETVKEEEQELKELREYKSKIEEIIDENFSDFSDFCEKCCAKGKCNGSCCYEQIKEFFRGVEQ